MGDPATVIDQYRRYVQDGRLEISEVMASELSDLLLSKKGKSLAEQGHLVTALRDLAKIHGFEPNGKRVEPLHRYLSKHESGTSNFSRQMG